MVRSDYPFPPTSPHSGDNYVSPHSPALILTWRFCRYLDNRGCRPRRIFHLSGRDRPYASIWFGMFPCHTIYSLVIHPLGIETVQTFRLVLSFPLFQNYKSSHPNNQSVLRSCFCQPWRSDDLFPPRNFEALTLNSTAQQSRPTQCVCFIAQWPALILVVVVCGRLLCLHWRRSLWSWYFLYVWCFERELFVNTTISLHLIPRLERGLP